MTKQQSQMITTLDDDPGRTSMVVHDSCTWSPYTTRRYTIQQYSPTPPPPTATTTINNNAQSVNINNLIEILIDNNNSIQNAMNSINNLFSNQNAMLLNLLNELKK
ncbi:unnamed protein product [Rotaria magnacalcarata]|uniref:Uncharacterized protein n=2 Tax=Rotaria magnacalcarata TaxID=392030 RepID=A0A820H2S6_9BILA|nr:unnamed protein product [Rotaria magnacalcarata]CAF4309220.1 unnamed protein product [Rotaria magnacalcarata]